MVNDGIHPASGDGRRAGGDEHPAGADEPQMREALARVEAIRESRQVQQAWRAVDEVVRENQRRVLDAFQRAGVAQYQLAGTSGYGYNDPARQAVEAVYAYVFGAEAALVRPQIVSGTHALAAAIFGVLRPGDELLALGRPYDTLTTLIGVTPDAHGRLAPGNLREWGIGYREVPIPLGLARAVAAGGPRAEDEYARLARTVEAAIGPRTRLLLLQRSRGYSQRPSLPVAAIGEVAQAVHARHPQVVVLVDNCYGEFVEVTEPSMAGADLVAGSLIKNPGGGLAPGGGYLVGRQDLIEGAAAHLTAPGLGREIGPFHDFARLILQGLFLAPHIVGEALRGAILAAAYFQSLGWPVDPLPGDPRTDIIQAIQFPSASALLAAVRAVQSASPIDARVRPEPAPMPGYSDPVVMAAGTFIQGASLELTADAPLRPPFTLFWQGGLTREHVEIALARVACTLDQELVTRSEGREG